jgi:hypothetical protein
MDGVADDNGGDRETAGETGERAEIFALVAAAFKRENGLRGETELVRDRNADAAVADVEAEIARVRGQRVLPKRRRGGSRIRRDSQRRAVSLWYRF